MSKDLAATALRVLSTVILLAVIALCVWIAWSVATGVLALTLADLLIGAAIFGIGFLFGRAAS